MIDYLAIGVTHLLLFLAAIRLLSSGDLDRDVESAPVMPQTPAEPDVVPHAPPPGRVGGARLPRRNGGRRA